MERNPIEIRTTCANFQWWSIQSIPNVPYGFSHDFSHDQRPNRLLGRLALVDETGRQLGGAGVHGGTELLHLQGDTLW